MRNDVHTYRKVLFIRLFFENKPLKPNNSVLAQAFLFEVWSGIYVWSIGPEIGRWNANMKVFEIPHLNGHFGEIMDIKVLYREGVLSTGKALT